MSGIARFVLVLAWLCAPVFPAAAAEPIKLKLAYFSSDRTTTYLATIKPFVDAVNAEAADLLEIEVHFSGALGKDPRQQLQLVLDGTADIAFIAPGYTPERFPDNTLIELPGMFRGIRDATLVYTRLVAANALRGYEDLFVIGAFATEPESIHAKVVAGSLDELQGKRIRANNPAQAAALTRLGMQPVQMPINQVSARTGRRQDRRRAGRARAAGRVRNRARRRQPLHAGRWLGAAGRGDEARHARTAARARPAHHPQVQRGVDGRALRRDLSRRKQAGDPAAQRRRQTARSSARVPPIAHARAPHSRPRPTSGWTPIRATAIC